LKKWLLVCLFVYLIVPLNIFKTWTRCRWWRWWWCCISNVDA